MLSLLPVLLLGFRGHAVRVEQNAHGCISVELETEAEDSFEFVADLFYPNRKYRTGYFNESLVAPHSHSLRKKSRKHRKQLTLNNKHKKGGFTINTESVCVALKAPNGIWGVFKMALAGETDGTEANSKLSITGTATIGWTVLYAELETTFSGPSSAAQAEAPLATVWKLFEKFGSSRLKDYKASLSTSKTVVDEVHLMWSKVQTRYQAGFRGKVLDEAEKNLEDFWQNFQDLYKKKVTAKPKAFKDAITAGIVEVQKYLTKEVFQEAFKKAFPVLTSTYTQSFFAAFGEEVGKTDGFQHLLKRFIQGGYFSPTYTDFEHKDPVYQVGLYQAMFPDLFGLITECEFNADEDTCYSSREDEFPNALIDLNGGVEKCVEKGVSPDFCGADWRVGHVARMLKDSNIGELKEKVAAEFNVDVDFTPPLKWKGFGVGVKFGIRTDAVATGKDALKTLCGANRLALYVDAGVKFSYDWDDTAKLFKKQKGNIRQVRGVGHFELPSGAGALEFGLSIETNPEINVGYKVPIVINLMIPYTKKKIKGVEVSYPDAGSLATFIREQKETIEEIRAGTLSLSEAIAAQASAFYTKTKAIAKKTALSKFSEIAYKYLKENVVKKIKNLKFEGIDLPFDGLEKAFKDAAANANFFKNLAGSMVKDFLPDVDVKKLEKGQAYGMEAQINLYKKKDQKKSLVLMEFKLFLLNEEAKELTLNVANMGIAGKRSTQTGGLLMTSYMCRKTVDDEFELEKEDSCKDQKTHFESLM